MKFPLYVVTAALSLALGLGSSSAVGQDKSAADPAQAKADEASVPAEIIILHATNDGSGIDPKIGKMPQLGKPPFSSYNSYKLLERVKVDVARGKSTTAKLPDEHVLHVSLKDIVAGKKKDDPKKYVVGASIQKPGGNAFLPLLHVNAKAGETFFVAGQTHKGGILFIGIKLAP